MGVKYYLATFLFVFWNLFIGNSYAQITPTNHFPFDGCSIIDNQSSLVGFTNTDCECGVVNQALAFNDPTHSTNMPTELTDVFLDDFTISFFIWNQGNYNANEVANIMSISNAQCSLDSVFYVWYIPSRNELSVNISDNINSEIQLSGNLGENRCWNYVVISRSNNEYQLIINNELKDSKIKNSPAIFINEGTLTLGASPCTNLQDVVPFVGLIDEFRVYDIGLDIRSIKNEDLHPMSVLEETAIIYLGQEYEILNGQNCSFDANWSPTDFIISEDKNGITVKPKDDITYTLTVDGGNCTNIDSIHLIIVDTDSLNCENVKIPSAFTPNGDGLNDTYYISNSFIIDELLSFEVFDKWGGRMFSNVVDGEEWNGTHRNKPVMPGPYVYRINYMCGGNELIKSGIVNVIR